MKFPTVCLHLMFMFLTLSVLANGVNANIWKTFEKQLMPKGKPNHDCVPPCKIFHSWCQNNGKCRVKSSADCRWYCECPANCEGYFCEKIVSKVSEKGANVLELTISREKKKDVSTFGKSQIESALANIIKKSQTNVDNGNDNKPAEGLTLKDRIGKTLTVNVTETIRIICPSGKLKDTSSPANTTPPIATHGNGNGTVTTTEPSTGTTSVENIGNLSTNTSTETTELSNQTGPGQIPSTTKSNIVTVTCTTDAKQTKQSAKQPISTINKTPLTNSVDALSSNTSDQGVPTNILTATLPASVHINTQANEIVSDKSTSKPKIPHVSGNSNVDGMLHVNTAAIISSSTVNTIHTTVIIDTKAPTTPLDNIQTATDAKLHIQPSTTISITSTTPVTKPNATAVNNLTTTITEMTSAGTVHTTRVYTTHPHHSSQITSSAVTTPSTVESVPESSSTLFTGTPSSLTTKAMPRILTKDQSLTSVITGTPLTTAAPSIDATSTVESTEHPSTPVSPTPPSVTEITRTHGDDKTTTPLDAKTNKHMTTGTVTTTQHASTTKHSTTLITSTMEPSQMSSSDTPRAPSAATTPVPIESASTQHTTTATTAMHQSTENTKEISTIASTILTSTPVVLSSETLETAIATGTANESKHLPHYTTDNVHGESVTNSTEIGSTSLSSKPISTSRPGVLGHSSKPQQISSQTAAVSSASLPNARSGLQETTQSPPQPTDMGSPSTTYTNHTSVPSPMASRALTSDGVTTTPSVTTPISSTTSESVTATTSDVNPKPTQTYTTQSTPKHKATTAQLDNVGSSPDKSIADQTQVKRLTETNILTTYSTKDRNTGIPAGVFSNDHHDNLLVGMVLTTAGKAR